jgi:signal transduction histidine kinase
VAERQVLDFLRSAEPRPVLSRRVIAADIALAAVATLAALISAAVRYQGSVSVAIHKALYFGIPQVVRFPPMGSPGLPWLVMLGVALTAAPLAVRRRYPATAFWVMLAAVFATSSDTTTVTFIAVIFAAYCAVAFSRFRGLALLSVLLAATIVTAAFPNTTPPLPGRFTALLMLIPAAAVGSAVHSWRRRAGDSAERLRRAQAEHSAETLRAVAWERARIASELHDVVTHNVSVMVVQAGAARQVLASSPDDAREALLAVEASGRMAMTELRYLLGLLTPDMSSPPGTSSPAGTSSPSDMPSPSDLPSPSDAPLPPRVPGARNLASVSAAAGAAGAGDAVLRPQPGLGQLPSLVARVSAAGLPVELSVAGTQRAVPPGPDLAAYRVVQEGLTNVLKHAGQARTHVRLDYRPAELVIEVADDGGGASPGCAAGAGPGRGLIGLRERIAIYGGNLDAGPRPGGGWRIRAVVPWPGADPPPRPGDSLPSARSGLPATSVPPPATSVPPPATSVPPAGLGVTTT